MALRLILCGVLLLTLVPNTWAEETILALGVQTSYLFPHTDSAGGKVEVEGGQMWGAGLTYGYQDRGIELSIEWVATDIEGDTVDGELIMIPVMISGFWRFYASGRRLIPSLGIGIGIVVNQFRNSQKAKALDLDNEIVDTVGIQVLGGVEYFIKSRISIFLNARYLYAKADVQTKTGNVINRHRIGLDTIISGMGIKTYF